MISRARVLAFAAVLLLAGCGRDQPQPPAVHPAGGGSGTPAHPAPAPDATPAPPAPAPTATPPAATTNNPLAVPGEYLETVVAAKSQAQVKVALSTLSQRVQAFQALNDRLPASLDELAKEGPLPPLPANLTYSYDPKTGTVDVTSK